MAEPDLVPMARGVRLLTGEHAALRRKVLNVCFEVAKQNMAEEILLPCVEPAEVYADKAGPEILGQMYVFPDRKGRQLCLRPEGTATVQLLARQLWPKHKDVLVCYEARCWRYERPQAGRYREFTQFGIEWLWPRDVKEAKLDLIGMARQIVYELVPKDCAVEVADAVKRGLAYYTEDGFEISIPSLGAQKQVCGGGAYAEGIGFAVGVDRLMLAAKP